MGNETFYGDGLKLRFIVMSINLEYRGRERQRKEKVGERSEKLNKKKSDRELEQEIKKKTKETNFVGRTT